MFINSILVIVSLVALGYTLRVVSKKFSSIARINPDATPERRQLQIKRQILEDKLKRDFQKRWGSFRDSFLRDKKKRISEIGSHWHQRLKDLEQEYRAMARGDLSTHVTQSRTVDDIVSVARDAITKGEYAAAEQQLLECLKTDEHNIKVYSLLAQLYKHKGEYDHAKETLEYILKLSSGQNQAGIFTDLADIARTRGDLAGAQDEYLKSIAADPENYRHYLDLAELHHVMEKYTDARENAIKALELAPNNPKILDFMIENSILLQDKSRAGEYLAKLIEVNPQNGKIASFKNRIDMLSAGNL